MTGAIVDIVFTLIVLAVLATLIVPRVLERRRLDGRSYHHHRHHEVPR
jgi:hypothetical protein